MMGSVVQFGSSAQAVVALSSEESELYAIGTGAHSKLHQGSNNNKGEHSYTYRQRKRKEHSDKNWLVKESKAH